MEAEGIMEQRSSDTTIHDLPDHILQHILSLLFSTKYAVRTCVLSKRWVYLWKDISNILLPQTGFKSRQQFINFVSRFYQVYDCSNIRSLFFCCQVGEDAPQINEWLQGFINPNIQELSVYVGETKEPLVFPEHLFTCATLTKFKVCMKHIFKIPFSIQFESLRTLTLNSIIFPDTSSTQQFFNGCPCLEVLDLYYCNWMNVDSVCICPPMLQKVTIIEGRGKDKPNEATRVSNYCNVMIDGNSLKSFSYRGDLRNDYFLYSSTSVMIASIDIHAPKSWNKNVALFVFKLLHALSNAENLSITPISLSALSCATRSLLGHLPLFRNLAELHVYNYYSMSPIQLSCEALLTIIRKSPLLKRANFEGGVSLPTYFAKNNYILDPLPLCFWEHLKTIKIYHGFMGYHDDEELHAIKILLLEASVLETLLITCSSNFYAQHLTTRSHRLQMLYKQIVGFPRLSIDCEIIISYEP